MVGVPPWNGDVCKLSRWVPEHVLQPYRAVARNKKNRHTILNEVWRRLVLIRACVGSIKRMAKIFGVTHCCVERWLKGKSSPRRVRYSQIDGLYFSCLEAIRQGMVRGSYTRTGVRKGHLYEIPSFIGNQKYEQTARSKPKGETRRRIKKRLAGIE